MKLFFMGARLTPNPLQLPPQCLLKRSITDKLREGSGSNNVTNSALRSP
jgi:hypothetical protein